jgi:HD-GYP domain-containing protein (c-di-GMP phosphodiesterase class II)
MQSIRLSELLGAFSHALDITEGQPEGHCVRCCWIGTHVGRRFGLSEDQLWELYYTLMLKDLGCSSNAARICELYVTDDLAFKRDFKWVDGSLPKVLRFVIRHTGEGTSLTQRLQSIFEIMANGNRIARELIETRCTRGAEIARQLRFSETVATGIHSLDEHWDGSGQPEGLSGDRIPLYARIALLAQVVDVFNSGFGTHAAVEEIRARRGGWFDPELCDAFDAVAKEAEFWAALESPDIEAKVVAM